MSVEELLQRKVSTERARRSLVSFVRQAWHIIEPVTPLIWSWHIEAICLHLQAVTEGRIKKLIINVPPGSGKSSIVSVLWPCWEWIRDPSLRMLFASHKDALAIRDSLRRRWVIESDWYRSRWPIQLAADQNTKHDFHNNHKGYMIALGRGGATGYRGARLIMDDPNSATEMESETIRESTLMWLDGQWSTRGDDNAREVVIQQRTHQRDVSGHLLQQGGWEHLRIPMRFDSSRPCSTSIGWSDLRKQEGELMDLQRFPNERVVEIEQRLGSYMAAGQLQQTPAPAEGGIIKRAWLQRRYQWGEDGHIIIEGRRFPHTDCLRFGMVDLATSTKQTADYTVISSWAIAPGKERSLILLDVIRDRIEGPDIIPAIRSAVKRWTLAFVGIEKVGFQLSLIQQARREGLPVREIEVDRDKASRLIAATPLMEAGRLWLPNSASWMAELEAELLTFPRGAHDDIVDCVSMACAFAEKCGDVEQASAVVKVNEVDDRLSAFGVKPQSPWDAVRVNPPGW